jgi:hypothetical protein
MSHHEAPIGDAEKRAIIVGMFAALEAGDFEAASAGVAEDFVQEWPQSGERISGREHCTIVWRNYPGGMPTMATRAVRGSGDLWVVESSIEYPAGRSLVVSLLEFRGRELARQVDYFAEPFPAPAWRSGWVTVDPGMVRT